MRLTIHTPSPDRSMQLPVSPVLSYPVKRIDYLVVHGAAIFVRSDERYQILTAP